MIVGVTVTVASRVRVTLSEDWFGLRVEPIDVTYQSASFRTSVPQ